MSWALCPSTGLEGSCCSICCLSAMNDAPPSWLPTSPFLSGFRSLGTRNWQQPFWIVWAIMLISSPPREYRTERRNADKRNEPWVLEIGGYPGIPTCLRKLLYGNLWACFGEVSEYFDNYYGESKKWVEPKEKFSPPLRRGGEGGVARLGYPLYISQGGSKTKRCPGSIIGCCQQ